MNIIKLSEETAKKEYAKNDKQHQWKHVEEVMDTALKLTKFYSEVDLEILKLAVIFHDITYKKYETHVEDSIKFTENFLKRHNYPEERIKKITEVMIAHSGPHRRKLGDTSLIEGKIIYDSDKFHLAFTKEGYEKYYPRFYLPETKELLKNYLDLN